MKMMTKTQRHNQYFIIVTTFVFALIGFITIYPFWNVIVVSLNDSIDTVKGGLYFWPRKFTLHNYKEVMLFDGLIKASFNSVMRTVIGTAIGVVFTSMLSFALSRKDFVARKLFTLLFLVTMYVSGGLIPTYILIKKLGLTNNFLVYIIPMAIFPFCIFLVRSFIEGLPMSLQESAMIDGANDFIIFVKIILPLCKPVLAAIALFYAVAHWNSWFDAYLYNNREISLTVLQYELQKIIQSASAAVEARANQAGVDFSEQSFVSPKSLQMAVTVVATFPIVVVYPFLQKYFVKGMTLGAVKE